MANHLAFAAYATIKCGPRPQKNTSKCVWDYFRSGIIFVKQRVRRPLPHRVHSVIHFFPAVVAHKTSESSTIPQSSSSLSVGRKTRSHQTRVSRVHVPRSSQKHSLHLFRAALDPLPGMAREPECAENKYFYNNSRLSHTYMPFPPHQ